MKPYIEIVHVDALTAVGQMENGATEQSRITAWRILVMIQAGATVLRGNLEANIPTVALDTPIILGGSDRDVCCRKRKEFLQQQGFTNVSVSDTISYGLKSIGEDWAADLQKYGPMQ